MASQETKDDEAEGGVYVLSSKQCKHPYVGETGRKKTERIKEHRSSSRRARYTWRMFQGDCEYECFISGFKDKSQRCRFERALKKCRTTPMGRQPFVYTNVQRKVMAVFSVASSVWWQTKLEQKKAASSTDVFRPPPLKIQVRLRIVHQIGRAAFDTCLAVAKRHGIAVETVETFDT